MERLFDQVMSNWRVISTLEKDEKLIVCADSRLEKHRYSSMQYLGRRLWGHGFQETLDGLQHLWDCTNALTDLLLNHEALNQIRYFTIQELKDIELHSYREKLSEVQKLCDILKKARVGGLKNLIETYNHDCALERIGEFIDGLLKKMDAKLAQLRYCEIEGRQIIRKFKPPFRQNNPSSAMDIPPSTRITASRPSQMSEVSETEEEESEDEKIHLSPATRLAKEGSPSGGRTIMSLAGTSLPSKKASFSLPGILSSV